MKVFLSDIDQDYEGYHYSAIYSEYSLAISDAVHHLLEDWLHKPLVMPELMECNPGAERITWRLGDTAYYAYAVAVSDRRM